MQVWYSDMFVHWPKDLGARKLGEHGHPAKFLGYSENSAGYKVYDPITHKVEVAHALIFHETALPCPDTIFETPADDSDHDGTHDTTASLSPEESTMHDNKDSSPHLSTPPPTAQSCPTHS